MANVGQGKIGDHEGIEGLHAPQDDDHDQVIIGSGQPYIGGGRPTVMSMKVKMMVDRKMMMALMIR